MIIILCCHDGGVLTDCVIIDSGLHVTYCKQTWLNCMGTLTSLAVRRDNSIARKAYNCNSKSVMSHYQLEHRQPWTPKLHHTHILILIAYPWPEETTRRGLHLH